MVALQAVPAVSSTATTSPRRQAAPQRHPASSPPPPPPPPPQEQRGSPRGRAPPGMRAPAAPSRSGLPAAGSCPRCRLTARDHPCLLATCVSGTAAARHGRSRQNPVARGRPQTQVPSCFLVGSPWACSARSAGLRLQSNPSVRVRDGAARGPSTRSEGAERNAEQGRAAQRSIRVAPRPALRRCRTRIFAARSLHLHQRCRCTTC